MYVIIIIQSTLASEVTLSFQRRLIIFYTVKQKMLPKYMCTLSIFLVCNFQIRTCYFVEINEYQLDIGGFFMLINNRGHQKLFNER